jgi:Na+/H+ antiporter NhaD/arsenite permease-like protein
LNPTGLGSLSLGFAGGDPVPLWAVAPFVALLLAIATGPLLFPKLWHHGYPKIALGLGGAVVAYYLLFRNAGGAGYHKVLETGIDYVAFVSLIGSLFVVTSAILLHVKGPGSTQVNVAILGLASILASLLGTTGASMLLIRPYLRINRGHFGAHHLVFFIFLVSNVGGALTPIGDPPLFLGYLLGVPFFWTAERLLLPWFLTVGALLLAFAVIDSLHARRVHRAPYEEMIKIEVAGFRGFLFLFGIIALAFVENRPFAQAMQPWSKLGIAVGMAALAAAAYRAANPKILKENEFSFAPVREVAILFAGIFGTMLPALEYLYQNANDLGMRSPLSYYFATGSLSAFLDNAPTYLTFFTASLGQAGRSVGSPADVALHIADPVGEVTVAAIACGAVFFGAMTYIGNGPNLMVKSIVESAGVKCPSFFGYLFRWAVPILLPILVLVGFLFFRSV